MWILGIAGSHNAAAALTRDGQVVVAVQVERITRRKRQGLRLNQLGAEAVDLIRYCLEYAGIELGDIDYFATSTPHMEPKVQFKDQAAQQLFDSSPTVPRIVSVPHHLAHAEYVLHYSTLERGLVLVADGSGTWSALRSKLDLQEREDPAQRTFIGEHGPPKESISAYRFEHGVLQLIFRAYSRRSRSTPDGPWLDSLGHVWRWVARYCHGGVHDAGKVMGLAPYGDPDVHSDLKYLTLSDDGESFIDYGPLLLRFQTPNENGHDVTGEHHYSDLAAHLQKSTNEFLVRLVRQLQRRFPTDNLYYSGGLALNSVANDHLMRTLGLNLLMNGSCEDNGTAIGAAMALYHSLTGRRLPEEVTEYYGRAYDSAEIEAALRHENLKFRRLPTDEAIRETANAIAQGRVVGWFQGRSEFGPRALGNRSILADPRRAEMKDILNSRIKFREAFRPFAPAVLAERAEEYFDLAGQASPLMLRVAPVKVDTLPAITHVDNSARVQTVSESQNSLFHLLLREFGKQTGIPVLLNTSFNVAGEPIVECPRDAIKTFLRSGIDALVLGGSIVEK